MSTQKETVYNVYIKKSDSVAQGPDLKKLEKEHIKLKITQKRKINIRPKKIIEIDNIK